MEIALDTPESWQRAYDRGWIQTLLEEFDTYVHGLTNHVFWPAYSYLAHSIIDDYNLDDESIKRALSGEWQNEALIKHTNDMFKDYAEEIDCTTEKQWESWPYRNMIKGFELTVRFLEFLLTIPESERDVLIFNSW